MNSVYDLSNSVWVAIKHNQTIFYLIFKLIGLKIDAELHTNQGRIDAVIELADRIYLFEFKLDGSATEALQQIKDNQYAQRQANLFISSAPISIQPLAPSRNGSWNTTQRLTLDITMELLQRHERTYLRNKFAIIKIRRSR